MKKGEAAWAAALAITIVVALLAWSGAPPPCEMPRAFQLAWRHFSLV